MEEKKHRWSRSGDFALNEDEKQPRESRDGPPQTGAEMPKIIPFSSLSRCGDEVWIETGGQVYRLRKTRQGKLILTK